MIERELCMNAIGYNLIRCVMQEAAQSHDVELGLMSFKGGVLICTKGLWNNAGMVLRGQRKSPRCARYSRPPCVNFHHCSPSMLEHWRTRSSPFSRMR